MNNRARWQAIGTGAAAVAVVAGSQVRPVRGSPTLWPSGDVPSTLTEARISERLWNISSNTPLNIIVFLALTTLCVAWVQLIREHRAGPTAPRHAVTTAVLWALPFALGPVMFSRDVYSYAAQGRIVAIGLDPYRVGPLVLGRGSGYVAFVDWTWMKTPAPYGPLWTKFAGVASAIGGDNPLVSVLLLRLASFAAWAFAGWMIYRVARRLGSDPMRALLLVTCNPLLIIQAISGVHNDALVLALALVAVELTLSHRWRWAALVIGCAASVKMPVIAGLVFLPWAMPGQTARERLRRAAESLLIGVATMASIAWATGLGWGWVDSLRTTGRYTGLMSPLQSLGEVGRDLASVVGIEISRSGTESVLITLGLIVAVGLALVILSRSDRDAPPVALGSALLAVALLGPTLYPWYILLPLALMSLSRYQSKRTAVVVLSVLLTVSAGADGSTIVSWLGNTGPWFIPLAASCVAWWLFRLHRDERRLESRAGTGDPLGDQFLRPATSRDR